MNQIEVHRTYEILRKSALHRSLESLGLDASQFPENKLFGGLMEFVLQDAKVTLACFITGDASLYTSRGFGVVGGFAHEQVRSAAREFVALCEESRVEMAVTEIYPLPREGALRFYALSEQAAITIDVAETSLRENNKIYSLRNAGQTVITALRQVASDN